MEMGGVSTGGITNVNLNTNKNNRLACKVSTTLVIRCTLGKQVPVYDIVETLQSVLDALDGICYSVTLKPEVLLVLPLSEQTAAVA